MSKLNYINSLALRLFLSASVWILLTLISGGLLLSDIFRESTEKAFDDKLNLFMETLIGSSKIDSTESITVVNPLGDPRFFQPYSGWYWQINKGSQTLVRSRSMWDQVLTLDKRLIGGRAQFINSNLQEKKNKKIVTSQKLNIVQREISFPGFDDPLTFMISGDTEEFEKNITPIDDITGKFEATSETTEEKIEKISREKGPQRDEDDKENEPPPPPVEESANATIPTDPNLVMQMEMLKLIFTQIKLQIMLKGLKN